MKNETLIHTCHLEIGGNRYEIQVFLSDDGRHVAKTILSRDDVLINDGSSLEEALDRQRSLLPLAVDSRSILQSYHSTRN